LPRKLTSLETLLLSPDPLPRSRAFFISYIQHIVDVRTTRSTGRNAKYHLGIQPYAARLGGSRRTHFDPSQVWKDDAQLDATLYYPMTAPSPLPPRQTKTRIRGHQIVTHAYRAMHGGVPGAVPIWRARGAVHKTHGQLRRLRLAPELAVRHRARLIVSLMRAAGLYLHVSQLARPSREV